MTAISSASQFLDQGGCDPAPAVVLGHGQVVNVDLLPWLFELRQHVRGKAAHNIGTAERGEGDEIGAIEQVAQVRRVGLPAREGFDLIERDAEHVEHRAQRLDVGGREAVD